MSAVNNKVVLITGGARGVGAEVARRLHEKGATVVLTDVDKAALAEIGRDLREDRVLTAVADVRDLAAMEEVASRAVDRFGGIDVVMANAGISTYGSVLKVDPEAFRTLIDVNIVGVFNTVRATLPSVIDRRGYVLIVSSAAAFAASPGLAPYNASKAAVEQFANALRLEVAHRGVAVGSAHMCGSTPRWCRTPSPICGASARCSTCCRVRSARPRRCRNAAKHSSTASSAESATSTVPNTFR